MNKYIKIIIIALLSFFIAWSIFVTIDCIRIKNFSTNIKPLIVLTSKDYETHGQIGTVYIGIGYTVDHYYFENCASSYGTSIKLFGLFTIWAEEAA